jgi:hypothetical protein
MISIGPDPDQWHGHIFFVIMDIEGPTVSVADPVQFKPNRNPIVEVVQEPDPTQSVCRS